LEYGCGAVDVKQTQEDAKEIAKDASFLLEMRDR
jgi:hypothetical protein